MYLNINENLILIGDNEQIVIFSRKFDNTPVQYIRNEDFKGIPTLMNTNYLLVRPVEKNIPIRYIRKGMKGFMKYDYSLVRSDKKNNKKFLLYNIFNEKQPVDVTDSTKFNERDLIKIWLYDYNSQTNKVYRVVNNDIIIEDFSKDDYEKDFKKENYEDSEDGEDS